jgi:exodeoxyribonuclease VII large subunit
MALTTSPQAPAAVRTIARSVEEWIARLGSVWIEGQIAQLTRRPGMNLVFLTLRDTEAEISISVSAPTRIVDTSSPPLAEGQRVIINAKPEYLVQRGSLTFRATEIRPVGLGELLAQLEARKNLLAAEGLFDDSRKKKLPFLPRAIGLICGRNSDAERDVVENARRRWPGAVFEIREVAVQGVRAVAEVGAALIELDAMAEVDVIVITRGGGSVEDLLPFSDEGLLRAVAKARTPVVSAIGHEKDSPLLDLVADVRASTPTDAARRVVPDMAEQLALINELRSRSANAVRVKLDRATASLDAIRARPALADPFTLLDGPTQTVAALRDRARRSLVHQLDRAEDDIAHRRAQVRALSPAATLERGYAIVRTADGHVVTDPDQAKTGEPLRVNVSTGEFTATRVDPMVVP